MIGQTPQTVLDLLTKAVSTNPNGFALLAPGRRPTSYSVLKDQVLRNCELLSKNGMSRLDRVAIVVSPGPEYPVVYFSVVTIATAAPLNPTYRREEFEFYFNDIGVTALIVQEGLHTEAVAAAQGMGLPILTVKPILAAEAGAVEIHGKIREAQPFQVTQPNDIALLLHTSGTTSRPKLVPLTHDNITHSGRNVAQALELTAADRSMAIMPLFHVSGLVVTTLSALSSAGGISYPPGFISTEFFNHMRECEPTWFTAVPTIHSLILSRAGANGDVVSKHKLRLLRSSAAALPPSVRQGLEKTFSVPIVDAYGLTESCGQLTSNGLRPEFSRLGSVGRAVGDEFRIQDDKGSFLPAGVPGEIVIRGQNVTRGYEDRFKKTNSATVDGWLPTGDCGYVDSDGYLYITSRIKEIINQGGEKISPLEIEDCLLGHHAIAEVVCFSVPDQQLGEVVGCAIVGKADVSVTKSEILDFLLEKVAAFKVPREIVIVSKIPKNSIGKVNRSGMWREIQPFVISSATDHLETGADQSKIDQGLLSQLKDVWAEVLSITRIDENCSFIQLGGDSILIGIVVSKLRKIFGVEIPPRFFFESKTIGEFCIRVGDLIKKSGGQREYSIPRVSRKTPIPITYTQSYYLGGPAKKRNARDENLTLNVFNLHGPVDPEILRKCLLSLSQRHEVFRTGIRGNHASGFHQFVLENVKIDLRVCNLQDLSSEEQQRVVANEVESELDHLFVLDSPPLWRASLVRMSKDESALIFNIPHFLTDRRSNRIFMDDLLAYYKFHSGETDACPPPIAAEYIDYCEMIRQKVLTGAFQNRIDYWKAELHERPSAPSLGSRKPGDNSLAGRILNWNYRDGLLEKLKEYAKRESGSIGIIFHVAFLTLLYRRTNQSDFTISILSSAREHPDIQGTMGFFAILYPVRVRFNRDDSFRTLFARVRDAQLRAAENSTPRPILMAEVGKNVCSPFLLNYFGEGNESGIQSKELRISLPHEKVFKQVEIPENELRLHFEENGSSLEGMVWYRTSEFPEEKSVINLMTELEETMHEIVNSEASTGIVADYKHK